MKKITAKTAIKIASQFLENGKIEDAKHILNFWKQLKLDGDVVVTIDESNNTAYMPLGFDWVDLDDLETN